jgi:hypothetical protein
VRRKQPSGPVLSSFVKCNKRIADSPNPTRSRNEPNNHPASGSDLSRLPVSVVRE